MPDIGGLSSVPDMVNLLAAVKNWGYPVFEIFFNSNVDSLLTRGFTIVSVGQAR